MNLMGRLAATLNDADELLADVDAQTIDECLARGEAPDHRVDDDEACPWCHHGFHGLGCYPSVTYLVTNYSPFDLDPVDDAAMPLTDVGGGLDWPCRCDSALDRLDDTWRPLTQALTNLMHQTGLDGWSAQALFNRSLDRLRAAEVGVEKWLGIRAQHLHMTVMSGRITPEGIVSGGLTVATISDFEPADLDGNDLVEPEETPAARALRHRQTRNTGPARPPAGRAHRPRRHT